MVATPLNDIYFVNGAFVCTGVSSAFLGAGDAESSYGYGASYRLDASHTNSIYNGSKVTPLSLALNYIVKT